jgi:CheY-like chemotaxis protein
MEKNSVLPTTGRPVQKAAILLLDENPISKLLAKKMLIKLGGSVFLADTPDEARRILDTQKIDVILLDVRMQKINGFDIIQIAREKGTRMGKHIPIIAFSDRASKDQQEKCLKSGLDEYLPKPIFEEELCRVLKRLHGNENELKPPEGFMTIEKGV